MLTAFTAWARRHRRPTGDEALHERPATGSTVLVVGACGAALERAVNEILTPFEGHHVAELTVAVVATECSAAALVGCMGGVAPVQLLAPGALGKAAETARRIAAALPQTVLVRHLACDGFRADALVQYVRSGRVDCVVAAGRPLSPSAWAALRCAAEQAGVPVISV